MQQEEVVLPYSERFVRRMNYIAGKFAAMDMPPFIINDASPEERIALGSEIINRRGAGETLEVISESIGISMPTCYRLADYARQLDPTLPDTRKKAWSRDLNAPPIPDYDPSLSPAQRRAVEIVRDPATDEMTLSALAKRHAISEHALIGARRYINSGTWR